MQRCYVINRAPDSCKVFSTLEQAIDYCQKNGYTQITENIKTDFRYPWSAGRCIELKNKGVKNG